MLHTRPQRALCAALTAVTMGAMTACTTTRTPEPYGTLEDGQAAQLYTVTNANGMTLQLTDYGATVVSLTAPDRDGNLGEVTVGFDTIEGWQTKTGYQGATVGRFGNRIAKGKFTLDGVEYTLATNNGENHLHGGNKGFDALLWDAKYVSKPGAQGVQFNLISPDGDEGYPGELSAQVTYWLNDKNELVAEFEATTDAPTICNLVNHTYWNLSGDYVANDINGHELTIYADTYLPVDEGLIPTADAPAPVAGTPMDFTSPTLIGARVDDDFEQLKLGGGYDHCWVVIGNPGTLREAVKLKDPASGRVMELWTDQPAVQFYGGNFLDGQLGRNEQPINYRHGLCLETEGFPDSPNRPDFPSAVLRPGETYTHKMIHRFYAE